MHDFIGLLHNHGIAVLLHVLQPVLLGLYLVPQPLEAGVLVLMVELLVESGQLIAPSLLGFLSAVQPLYPILGQGPPDGHLLGKATGAVGLWL